MARRRIFPTSATTLRVSTSDKRTSYMPCLQLLLLLTVWTGHVTINILPDDVLLSIFHFLRATYLDGREDAYRLWHLCWRRLVHVCPRWRSAVFTSPNSLDLRLVLSPSTRVELLGIWLPLPIIVTNMIEHPMPYDYDFDAAIVNYNRVCDIGLHLTISHLRRLVPGMQKQFPALIYLKLGTPYERGPPPPLPDAFLGGSVPRLRCLMLNRIPFPALPKLLLSATDLVRLALWDMPDSGYISPKTIVTSLAVLANLKFLTIEFKSSLTLDHDYQHPPLPTHTVLPVLTRFEFQGVPEYL
jgi:F-box-like